jgi:predicted component of type VI protein secretion system
MRTFTGAKVDATLLEPISRARPGGDDVRHDIVYSEISERVRRARGEVLPLPDDLPFDAIAEWHIVADTCHDVLRHRGKDLMIAAWYTEARFAIDGFPGLRDGLDLLRHLTQSFWETLYPQIEDGDIEARLRVFEWLDSRLAASVPSKTSATTRPAGAPAKPAPNHPSGAQTDETEALRRQISEVQQCLDSLEDLRAACQAKFDDAAPAFDNLRYALRLSLVDSAVRMQVQALLQHNQYDAASNLLRGLGGNDNIEKLLERIQRLELESRNRAQSPSAEPPAPPPFAAPAPPASSGAGPTRFLGFGPRPGANQPPMPRAPSTTTFATPTPPKVDFTLTAPALVAAGVPFEMFVWAHWPQERNRILARAREELHARDLVARTKGPFPIPTGTRLTVRLRILGAVIDEPEDTIIWDGQSTCASFVITLPELNPHTRCSGTAYIYAEDVQIAKIHFLLSSAGAKESVVHAPAMSYRTAFASYASDDRDAVLGRIQGIQKVAPDLNVFLDVLSLRSGQNWEQELWRVIPASDIFYLFWSAHARKSEWVDREWRCALRERGIGFIDPVPLQSPEESPPPPELSSLHFNDWTLTFRRARL